MTFTPLRPVAATKGACRTNGVCRTNESNGHSNGNPNAEVPPLVYRRSVGLCIFSKSQGNKVFAARRRDDASGSWQLPQVGIFFIAIETEPNSEH